MVCRFDVEGSWPFGWGTRFAATPVIGSFWVLGRQVRSLGTFFCEDF